jgi:hypothetical protein
VFEDVEEMELRVFFRRVDNVTGMDRPKEYDLPVTDLKEILNLFRQRDFDNGHYRIYAEVPGTNRERLILDLRVREGKIVPKELLDSNNDAPGSASSGSVAPGKDNIDNGSPISETAESPGVDSSRSEEKTPEAPPKENQGTASELPRQDVGWIGVEIVAATAMQPWRPQVHKTVASMPRDMSRVGRLLRRLGKPH